MKNVRFYSKSIFILEAIKGEGSKILIRCATRLDPTVYQRVLEEALQDMYVEKTDTIKSSTFVYMVLVKFCECCVFMGVLWDQN